jgi:Right handed beta helix region
LAKTTKPAVRAAWADDAAPTDRLDPGETFAAGGFPSGEIPPARQFLNWILNYCANGIRYFSRRGVVDYDAAETYSLSDIVRGDDNVLYQSLLNSNTANLPSKSVAWWGPINLYKRTPGEISASVTPASFGYASTALADVRRYGCKCDGATDDTSALQLAFGVASELGLGLIIPYGHSVKITRYVQVPSNTTLHILGKLQLTNRASGLYANGASNISIYGHKIGIVQDSVVVSNYKWNAFSVVAPSIHIRSSSNVLVDGLNLSYVQQGILISNATLNSDNAAAWKLTQRAPVNCRVTNCSAQFCEASGISMYSGLDCGYRDNYVYRCGDGGLWMMGCIDCEVVGNHRISPAPIPTDVATYGANNAAHPTTWNDEQGMEFEACLNLLIQGNVVKNFWAESIDIKNNCNRVLCSGNRVVNAENGSIVVRDGDPGDVAACMKISIVGNTISGHGTPQFNIATPGVAGAISIGSCFITEIVNNVIYAYQNTPGINCLGPGAYMADYPANPHQAALTVTGNTFDFKNTASEDETEIMFRSMTLGAIVIKGQYDSILCNNNHIRTDRYQAIDSRLNASAAISLTYISANNSFYPTSASISNNVISNWGSHGIEINGLHAATHSGLVVNGNAIACAGGNGILMRFTQSAICSNNSINQPGSGTGYAAISIAGAPGNVVEGIVCIGNVLTGRYDGGGSSSMTFGLSFAHCSRVIAAHNSIANASKAPINVVNSSGDHIFSGTTGFPRSGSGSPNGTQTSFYTGEMYFDSANTKWWAASGASGSVWTPLGG